VPKPVDQSEFDRQIQLLTEVARDSN
jgi:hypothetical protein